MSRLTLDRPVLADLRKIDCLDRCRRMGRLSLAGGLLLLVQCIRLAAANETGTEPNRAGQIERPNVVWIISDDQAWDDYGFMGHPAIQTPHLDRLAAESLTFTRGYVPTSLCRPSLATMITGLYPHQHRIVGNDPAPVDGETVATSQSMPEYQARRAALIGQLDRCEPLPQRLAAAGYLSMQTGKWWEGNFQRGGFTHGMTRGFPEPGGRHGDDGLTIGRQGLQPIRDFIVAAQESSTPFFLWYAPFLPHAPHQPPEAILAKYLDRAPSLPIARYWAMCEWFDATCGELLGFLDERGLRDNTVVVYVTDNGWLNLADRAEFAPRSKRSPYEGGIRTPLMIRFPQRHPVHIDGRHLASSIDLVPTMLAACGLPPDPALPGINLLDPAAVAARDTLYGEIFEHDVVDVERPSTSLRYRWIIQERWKLILPSGGSAPQELAQLFDLGDDPRELKDRMATHQATARELQLRLDQWWRP